MRKIFSILSIFLLLCSMIIFPSATETEKNITILFTHDLHSHLLPMNTSEGSVGGYARLMSVINDQKQINPDAILVDGGDFSMGSLFQSAYATNALELRIMGLMGYDATTFGNHEFDYLPKGLSSMLHSAIKSNDPLPAIVEANYYPPLENEEGYNEDSKLLWDALNAYGVQEYIILERGGIYYVIFGINGYNSDEYAPNSGMILENPIETAQKVVDKATKEVKDTYNQEPVVVCLSHSGLSGDKGEDYDLANGVNGIDVIISAHTHTKLNEPLIVNDTYIVAANEYGKYLGVLNLKQDQNGEVSFVDYELIPINDTIKEDDEIAKIVNQFKDEVNANYLSAYNLAFDDVLIHNSVEFESVDDVYNNHQEARLCNLFADAYKWSAQKYTNKEVDLAITATGVIRDTLAIGDIRVSDVFNAANLGVGSDGELVSVYLTGAELKTVLEIDASIQPLMSAAQLFPSGVEYSFNTNRMIFNKVDYAMLRNDDGSLEAIEDDKLYHVVTGTYACGMLGSVDEKSFGLLKLVPKDENGNPIDLSDLSKLVIRDENGVPLKEWYAISSYLQDLGEENITKYSETDGRKIAYSSFNPINLLRNANIFTYALLIIIFVFILFVILIFKLIKIIINKLNKLRT